MSLIVWCVTVVQALDLQPHSAHFPLEYVLRQLETKHMQVIRTLKLDFSEHVWVARKICGCNGHKCTSSSYQTLRCRFHSRVFAARPCAGLGAKQQKQKTMHGTRKTVQS